MIKNSSNLPHKRRQVALLIFFGFCVFILLASSVLSYVFYKKIKEAGDTLKETQGISLSVGFVCFNPFKGLFIKGLRCERAGEVFLESGHLDVGFDLLSLLRHRVSIKNIEAARLRVSLGVIAQLLAQEGDEQVKMAPQVLDFFETVHFKVRNMWFDDNLEMDISGYISSIRQKFFISRGKAVLKRIRIPGVSVGKPFDNNDIFSSFDYAVEMESQEGDLVISRCEFSNSVFGFFGEGRVKDYKKEAYVSFTLSLPNTALDSFSFLNNSNLRSRGFFDCALAVAGPVGALDMTLSGKLKNAKFTFFDGISLEQVNCSFIFSKSKLLTKDFCLRVNGVPLCSQLDCSFEPRVHILFKLFTPDDIERQNNFVLDLDGVWFDRSLCGGLDIGFRYASEEACNEFALEIKGSRLSYEKRLFFSAKDVKVSLGKKPLEMAAVLKPFSKDLVLKDMSFLINRADDGIVFNDLKAVCYDGELSGDLRILPGKQAFSAQGRVRMNRVDLTQVFEGVKGEGSFLSGRLSGKIDFDSEKVQMLEGSFFVTDGFIEETPLLNSVADFLGVNALKKVVFDKLIMTFVGGKGDYAAKVRLLSSKVNAVLDAKIITYDKIEGYLSVSLATDLLNESKQFSKILKYIKHSESNVVFPFKISSYVDSPRVLWLKNEFKDKLSNLLPESNKRYLQQQLNGMVEKMAEE